MAVRGGDLIHVGNQVLLDRAQTAGPGQVSIPTEKIYELGNYQAVGTVLDIPDLTFPLESFDASAEMEAMIVGKDFASDPDGTIYDVSRARPIDIASQFKAGRSATNPFDVEVGVSVPFLTIEQLSYRFGITENAQQSMSLKGDSIYYTPGSVYIEEFAGTGTGGQVCSLSHDAYPYLGDVVGGRRFALSVSLVSGKRLRYAIDFTETQTSQGTAQGIDVVINAPVATDDKIRISYSSDTAATYPQVSHAAASATRPAAIRGRNIKVFVGGTDLTDEWTGVQSFNCEWRVNLERDQEFGSSEVVAQDFDVPTVNGSIDFLPRDPTQLYRRVAQVAGVTSPTEVVGALQQAVLPLDIVLYSPSDGSPLKTLHVPDARLTVPGYSGRVQQKLTVSFNFESDGGILKVAKGER